MSRNNNNVSSTLVTTGNADVLAAGGALSGLAVGQLGFFDGDTNLAVDDVSLGTQAIRNLFLAVGVDSTGGSTLDSVRRSAGQKIPVKNIQSITYRPYSASTDQVIEIVDYTGACDTEFLVKLEFRNQEIYRIQGYNQFSKTYAAKTPCCDGCETCPTGDANEVSQAIRTAIEADPNALVTVEYIARSTMVTATINAGTSSEDMTTTDPSAGDVIVEQDLLAMIQYNEETAADEAGKFFSDIRLTLTSLAVRSFCDINTKYFHPRTIVAIPSLLGDGFDCNGTVSTTVNPVNSEGVGYDIKQQEYHDNGWTANPGPYRASTVVGLAKDNFQYLTDTAVNYDMFVIRYAGKSYGDQQSMISDLQTCIAVPTGDTTTINAIRDVLDTSFFKDFGFDDITDDIASFDADGGAGVDGIL